MPGDPGEAVCRRVMVGPPPGPTVRLRLGLTSVNRLGKVRLPRACLRRACLRKACLPRACLPRACLRRACLPRACPRKACPRKVRLRGALDGRICGDTAVGLGVRLPGRRSRFEARERVGVPGGLPRGGLPRGGLARGGLPRSSAARSRSWWLPRSCNLSYCATRPGEPLRPGLRPPGGRRRGRCPRRCSLTPCSPG